MLVGSLVTNARRDTSNRVPPTILFTINSFSGGGAERSTIQIVKNWEGNRFAPRLLVGSMSGPYQGEVDSALIAAVVGRLRMPTFLRYIKRVRRAIARSGAIAIVAYGAQAKVLLSARMMKLIPQIVIVVVQRNELLSKVRSQRRSRTAIELDVRISRALFRKADAVVGISKGVTDFMRAFLWPISSPIETIYNPIDTQHIHDAIAATPEKAPLGAAQLPNSSLRSYFSQLPRPIIISVGRLVQQKAHSDLLNAFSQMPKAHRGTLVVLGEGPLRESLYRQADNLGISKELWMPGFVDNPWWFVARSNLFAHSSHFEGFGRVLVEALACRVPIVSTDCPSGPREILESIPHARLCPVANPQALADAIFELLDYPLPTAVNLADVYAPRHVARQFERVVASALQHR